MIKQMSAERSRRAMVTEAEGKREAAIKVAQGEKEAMILRAEGEKQAAMLKAEGAALALKYIDDQAKLIDEKTLMLQYFTTLKDIASTPSTKFVLPLELFKLLKPFEEMIVKRTSKE